VRRHGERMSLIRNVAICGFLLMAFAALPAAGTAANMQWIGTDGSANMGGVYVDPYQLAINGTPTLALCDDFADHVAPPTQWQANVYTYADLVNGATTHMMDLNASNPAFQPLLAYRAAFYLATQLLATPLPSDQLRGELSFALWDLMYPSRNVLNNLTDTAPSSNRSDATSDESKALNWAQTATAADVVGLRIYSPIQGSGNDTRRNF